jgi:hypothetical protein
MAVPVFDTLKVMTFRILRGQSPFHPDKTHLHHLFVEMNFSHLSTSGIIVLVNWMIVFLLLLCWQMGAPVNVQVGIVVLLSLLFTWVFYFFMEAERGKNGGEGSLFFQRCCRSGRSTDFSASPFWLFISRIVDGKLLSGSLPEPETPQDVTPTKPQNE